MADVPYGTSFPENYGEMFSTRPPVYQPLEVGVPGILGRLSKAYEMDRPLMAPEFPVLTDSGFKAPQIDFGVPDISLKAAPQTTPTPEVDPDEELIRQFRPETRAQDEFFKLLSQMPQRERPDFKRRIAAGIGTLAASGNPAAGEKIIDEPYNQAVGDFKLRADILKDLAATERGANTNERMILNQLLTERRFDRKQTETERRNRELGDQAAARQRLQQWKVDNPDLPPPIRLGNGNYGIRNPKTNAIEDTGVKYGLSPLEDILLERESTQQRQAFQGELNTQLEGVRQQHRIEIEKLQAQLAEALAGAKALTPEQEKVAQFLKAQAAFNQHPEYKKFLSINEEGANTFKIIMPNTLPQWTSWGQQQKQENARIWIEINKTIYGQQWQPPKNIADIANPPGAKPQSQATPTPRPAHVPSNYIRVKQGNDVGWIDPREFNMKTMTKVP